LGGLKDVSYAQNSTTLTLKQGLTVVGVHLGVALGSRLVPGNVSTQVIGTITTALRGGLVSVCAEILFVLGNQRERRG
ncbi:MAG: hypothetical protein RMI89_09015, partial [Gloeomargarita sp. SKYBB_i_bin120]|nr:hypothetical protein [Gloeomargarita sp. SKYB120]MDW8178658.1 hypothetical protein [Gloeomargarita sp. SKYBB_i_bin120]